MGRRRAWQLLVALILLVAAEGRPGPLARADLAWCYANQAPFGGDQYPFQPPYPFPVGVASITNNSRTVQLNQSQTVQPGQSVSVSTTRPIGDFWESLTKNDRGGECWSIVAPDGSQYFLQTPVRWDCNRRFPDDSCDWGYGGGEDATLGFTPANLSGMWAVGVVYNNGRFEYVYFTIQAPVTPTPTPYRAVTAQPVSFGNVILNGLDQVVSAAPAIWQVENTFANGWSVTIAASDFSDGAHSISVGNFQVKLDAANIAVLNGSGPPASQLPAFAALSVTPQTLLRAAPPDGVGAYSFTPDFQLLLPAATYLGNYTASVAVTIIAGP